MLERLSAEEGMPGYYYAHVPSLSLTTHGLGMEGALEDARDLVNLWNEEKRAHGESITIQSGGRSSQLWKSPDMPHKAKEVLRKLKRAGFEERWQSGFSSGVASRRRAADLPADAHRGCSHRNLPFHPQAGGTH